MISNFKKINLTSYVIDIFIFFIKYILYQHLIKKTTSQSLIKKKQYKLENRRQRRAKNSPL